MSEPKRGPDGRWKPGVSGWPRGLANRETRALAAISRAIPAAMRRGTVGLEPPWIPKLKKQARAAVREHVEALVQDQGGWDAVSTGKIELIYVEAFYWAASNTAMDRVMAEGPIEPETGALRPIVSELTGMLEKRSRVLERIGLTREARKVENPLREYLSRRGEVAVLPGGLESRGRGGETEIISAPSDPVPGGDPGVELEAESAESASAGSESASLDAGSIPARGEGGTLGDGAFRSVPGDSEVCTFCGKELPPRKRRDGSSRKFCGPRCRKSAWVTASRAASVVDASEVEQEAPTVLVPEERILPEEPSAASLTEGEDLFGDDGGAA